jgi:hypothetical protein
MTQFAKGAIVKQIVTPIQGSILGYQIDQETGERLNLVEWTDANGDVQSRYFKDGELEAVA